MGDQGTARDLTSRDYPLVFTEGEKRFVTKFKDEGITLTGTGLSWTCDGAARGKAYGEIAGIRLRRMPTPGADTGQCHIGFSDGASLNVMSWTPAGFPDEGRAKIYHDFVAALHERLSRADRARIAFTAGFPGANAAWTRWLGNILLVVVPLFFVVAPLGVVVVAGEPTGYALAFAGAFMTYWIYRKLREGRALNEANRPRAYSPDHVPSALLP